MAIWPYSETVPFRKISTPGNQVKLWYFSQCMKMKSTQNRQKTENAERLITNFFKEKIENADSSKPVLNKIMTTEEKCLKGNFAAPLNCSYFWDFQRAGVQTLDKGETNVK